MSDRAVRIPDFEWSGKPVFRCRVCGPRYERVEGLASVLRHEAEAHPAAVPVVRESAILGADGKPLSVIEGAN